MTELAPSSPGNKSLFQTLGKEHSRRKTRPCKVRVQHVWTVKEQKKAAEPESRAGVGEMSPESSSRTALSIRTAFALTSLWKA